jgi:hypothetical protein
MFMSDPSNQPKSYDGDHKLGDFFLDQVRKRQGNGKIPEVLLTRKSSISDIPGFPASDWAVSLTFLTVLKPCYCI